MGDEMGKKISNTRKQFQEADELICSDSKRKCHEEKERLERENRGLLGAFTPKCKDNGSYETQQCHGSTGYCWCVDESGNEIQGTRKGPGRFRGCEEAKSKCQKK